MFDRVLNKTLILDFKKKHLNNFKWTTLQKLQWSKNSLATVLVTFKGWKVSSLDKIELVFFPYYFITHF